MSSLAPSPDRDALLDEKSSDLVDCRGSTRDQSGSDAMTGLQIELVFSFDYAQIRSQRCLGDRLGIVESFFWPLTKGLT